MEDSNSGYCYLLLLRMCPCEADRRKIWINWIFFLMWWFIPSPLLPFCPLLFNCSIRLLFTPCHRTVKTRDAAAAYQLALCQLTHCIWNTQLVLVGFAGSETPSVQSALSKAHLWFWGEIQMDHTCALILILVFPRPPSLSLPLSLSLSLCLWCHIRLHCNYQRSALNHPCAEHGKSYLERSVSRSELTWVSNVL